MKIYEKLLEDGYVNAALENMSIVINPYFSNFYFHINQKQNKRIEHNSSTEKTLELFLVLYNIIVRLFIIFTFQLLRFRVAQCKQL